MTSFKLTSCLLSLLVLSSCVTDAQINDALFGPSESEKEHNRLMAKLDAQNAQAAASYARVEQAVQSHRQASSSVQLGQSKQEVLNILPSQAGLDTNGKQSEAFVSNGNNIEIHYMRSGIIQDGHATDDEFTPYTFVNNKLAGIGWQVLGGAKTFGDTNAVARRNAATNNLILGVMGLQQQQQQNQQLLNQQRRQANSQRMDQLLKQQVPPPAPRQTFCNTVVTGANTASTNCIQPK